MKKIELLAERAKITGQILRSRYYTVKNQGGFPGAVERSNITEAELKASYEDSKRLLKKLDAINNTLFETDAREYIDVMGNRLNVATARKYLQEFYEDEYMDGEFADDLDTIMNMKGTHGGSNLRAAVYSRCIVRVTDNVDRDPLKLEDRREEFRKKKADWYYALKTAVAISDAKTEVELIY